MSFFVVVRSFISSGWLVCCVLLIYDFFSSVSAVLSCQMLCGRNIFVCGYCSFKSVAMYAHVLSALMCLAFGTSNARFCGWDINKTGVRAHTHTHFYIITAYSILFCLNISSSSKTNNREDEKKKLKREKKGALTVQFCSVLMPFWFDVSVFLKILFNFFLFILLLCSLRMNVFVCVSVVRFNFTGE